jgi:hypothetical protein
VAWLEIKVYLERREIEVKRKAKASKGKNRVGFMLYK